MGAKNMLRRGETAVKAVLLYLKRVYVLTLGGIYHED